ncbi:MAG: response regulator transcription factor [Bacteroidales bacterium]|nr:response regulator transcription factor [Bacteroidales bacterium]
MTIKCLAIDDEPLALKQIGSYIKKTPFLELVSLCNNPFSAMEFIAENQVDLLFVDISMPDLSGMDFVKSLTIKPLVVFTTAYSEYAIDGFKADAIDYLLKPIGYKDFLRAANKANSMFELKTTHSEQKEVTRDHLFVKSDYKIIRIEFSDIKYIESVHEYVRIHLLDDKPVMSHISLKSIEEQLPASSFLRVHRSFIVNSARIKMIERNRIVFDNNVYIPVSDQYKANFQKFLSSHSLF